MEDKIQLLKGKILALKIEINSNYNKLDNDVLEEMILWRNDMKEEIKYLMKMKDRINKINLIKSNINN